MLGGFLVMGGLGVVVGVGLALASKVFYVWVDPKIEAIDEALPGANCGGCGLPGCSANAAAIVEGKASPSSCVAGGSEIAVEIAEIMGVAVEEKEPDVARPGCTYGFQDADLKYLYAGVMDCRAASLLDGGSKVCPVGCLGLSTCVGACPFDAISMGPDNLPVVNLEKCTGCGTCERVCPKHIITISSYTRRIQHEYNTDECTAPCQRNCPAGIDIPAYIRQITLGNFLEAVRIIKEVNPLPLVCGRICVTPCEYECRRNLVDEPVAINNLKRFVTDYEMNTGERVHIPRAPESGKRVAIVGGGAEGLTAAYLLNRLGHDTTIFEATSRLGGLLRTGLPGNRLPREVLDWEINGILDAGVIAITDQKLGKDFTIESLLKEGHSSVYLATGGWDTHLAQKAGLEGPLNPMPGIQLLVDFLLEHRSGSDPDVGKRIVILGGGNAALEAAYACITGSAEEVHVVTRKNIEDTSFNEDQITEAKNKNILFYFKSAITNLKGEGDELTHVEIASISETDEEKEHIDIIADRLLTGSGRFPGLVYVLLEQEGEETDTSQDRESVLWETVLPYPGPFAENDTGFFRPGEETSDYKAVVEAIGAGRRATSSIQKYLYGEPVEAPANMIRNRTDVLNVARLEPVPISIRNEMPESAGEIQLADPSAEIATGYSEEMALTEAKRCLQCGLICYRRVEGKLH
ncbi:FAD-dependent oxidoreductase [Thermodesulfobacteriota bacterium]